MLTLKSLVAKRQIAGKRGFTLMEILIVLAIMSLLVGVVGTYVFGRFNKAKVDTTAVQIKSLVTSMETLKLDIGRDPTQEEGLQLLIADAGVPGWNGPYLNGGVLPQDAWKRDFVYIAPAEGEDSGIIESYGADGKEGGTGLNGDIQSRAPAAG